MRCRFKSRLPHLIKWMSDRAIGLVFVGPIHTLGADNTVMQTVLSPSGLSHLFRTEDLFQPQFESDATSLIQPDS